MDQSETKVKQIFSNVLNGKAGANYIVTGRSAQTWALISGPSSISGELDKVKVKEIRGKLFW